MDIQEFIGIAIVGALMSVVVNIVKNQFGTAGNVTKVITIVLAILVGGLYVWVRSTPYFETVVMVLMAASTVYSFLMK